MNLQVFAVEITIPFNSGELSYQFIELVITTINGLGFDYTDRKKYNSKKWVYQRTNGMSNVCLCALNLSMFLSLIIIDVIEVLCLTFICEHLVRIKYFKII